MISQYPIRRSRDSRGRFKPKPAKRWPSSTAKNSSAIRTRKPSVAGSQRRAHKYSIPSVPTPLPTSSVDVISHSSQYTGRWKIISKRSTGEPILAYEFRQSMALRGWKPPKSILSQVSPKPLSPIALATLTLRIDYFTWESRAQPRESLSTLEITITTCLATTNFARVNMRGVWVHLQLRQDDYFEARQLVEQYGPRH